MQIHFNDAYELLTSGSDTLKCMLQHEAAGSVMGLHPGPMSEEKILLLEKEVLPAIGRFIERAEEVWEARERLLEELNRDVDIGIATENGDGSLTGGTGLPTIGRSARARWRTAAELATVRWLQRVERRLALASRQGPPAGAPPGGKGVARSRSEGAEGRVKLALINPPRLECVAGTASLAMPAKSAARV
jgi:hypothetical protein